MPAIKSDAPVLVRQLLALLVDSDIYGERRGAAYGLAGLVKGLGILSLKQLDIMPTLTEAIQNKKNPRHREGYLEQKTSNICVLIHIRCFSDNLRFLLVILAVAVFCGVNYMNFLLIICRMRLAVSSVDISNAALSDDFCL